MPILIRIVANQRLVQLRRHYEKPGRECQSQRSGGFNGHQDGHQGKSGLGILGRRRRRPSGRIFSERRRRPSRHLTPFAVDAEPVQSPLLLAPIAATARIEHIGRSEIVGQHLALEFLRDRHAPFSDKLRYVVTELVPRLRRDGPLQRLGIG
jgi:hypothetical protein